ncbi:unnamed protein product, partial [marine sediment metagenome]
DVYDFEQRWTFPPCPQEWTHHPLYAECYGDGWLGMRRHDGTEGYWHSPSFTGLLNEYWDIHFYVEHFSRFAEDYWVASAVLQKKETGVGDWASTGEQLNILSGGDGVWTFELQEPYFHTGAPTGWEYRIWIRARNTNSSLMTQCVIRRFDVLANVADPP